MKTKETLFERMGSTYRKEGDYLLPNIVAPFAEHCTVGFLKRQKRMYPCLYRSGVFDIIFDTATP